MSNELFPDLPGLKWNVRRAPSFNTLKKTSVGGREYRAANQLYPTYRYKLAYEFLRDQRKGVDELRTLVGFFNSRRGAFDSFLFEDPDDHYTENDSFGVGTGTTTAFQLFRTFGGFSEPVFDLNGAPIIYKDGVKQTATTHYTVSSSGLVTFVSAPAAGAVLKWTGSFYWRCCFDKDEADFEKFLQDLWELKTCEFHSVPP